MRIILLGRPRLTVADHDVDLGPPRQRAVFVALAVDAPRPVAVSTVIERVWGDQPPKHARSAVYGYIMRIRQLLARLDNTGAPVHNHRESYSLEVDRADIDLLRFRSLVQDAGNGDDPTRRRLLDEAFGLLAGTPLEGLTGAWVDHIRAAHQQDRLGAVVMWARLELEAGASDSVIRLVRPLMSECPLAEQLVAVYLRALGSAGRWAEALDCYETSCQRLYQELRAEPGAELRRFHADALEHLKRPAVSAAADHDSSSPVTAHGSVAAPAQLPADLVIFVGRDHARAALDDLLTCESHPQRIAVITGSAGAGKTSLATYIGHQHRHRFPDGQLYAHLGAGDRPVDPTGILTGFLRALGVAESQLHRPPDERSALYRSILATRRVLVVLDDVQEASQARPLLPGAGPSAALLTSRSRIATLEVATRVDLDTFTVDEAQQLLSREVGTDRLNFESEAALELFRLCGYLPLALRIAGRRLALHPSWTVSDFVHRMADLRSRLDELTLDDLAMRTSLTLSYRQLDRVAAWAFRLLSLSDTPDLTARDAAALFDRPERVASRMLERLVDLHLVTPVGRDRYRMDDLVRAFALERADEEDDPADRTQAIARLAGCCAETLYNASKVTACQRSPGTCQAPSMVGYSPTQARPPDGCTPTAPTW